MTKVIHAADLLKLLNAAAQYGPDAWDAEHGGLRPEVLDRIRQERDDKKYRVALDALRADLEAQKAIPVEIPVVLPAIPAEVEA